MTLQIKDGGTYPWSEIFAFPLLNGRLRFEITEVFKIQPFIFTVEFDRAFFATLDYGINIIIDQKPELT